MPRSIARRAACATLGGILVVAAATPALAQRGAKAPAFGAADLVALPAQNWITNGGNVYNQRYSALAQINRENIDGVKAVWRVGLDGSGVGPGYSQQA